MCTNQRNSLRSAKRKAAVHVHVHVQETLEFHVQRVLHVFQRLQPPTVYYQLGLLTC